jgi:hypothetical protein
MKRLREPPSETWTPFAKLSVPCVHAGGLLPFQYWQLRDRCISVHLEREQLVSEAASTKALLESESAALAERRTEMARAILIYDAFFGKDAPAWPLTRAAVDDHAQSSSARAVDVWKSICLEKAARFNRKVALLEQEIRARATTDWGQTVHGFKRHLYQPMPDCDCILCVDPTSSLYNGHWDDLPMCYLCAQARVQARALTWHEARLCAACSERARAHGLCACCWGHVDAPSDTCSGRGDFRLAQATRGHELLASSAFDLASVRI